MTIIRFWPYNTSGFFLEEEERGNGGAWELEEELNSSSQSTHTHASSSTSGSLRSKIGAPNPTEVNSSSDHRNVLKMTSGWRAWPNARYLCSPWCRDDDDPIRLLPLLHFAHGPAPV